MLILKVKYAPLIGFTIGLFNMIPYIGAIVAVSIGILVTFITGGFGKAIAMAIVVIILQQIDANIINPKIIGSSLEISPLLVIFSITVGGAYFGILGMFLAVPIAVVLMRIFYKKKFRLNLLIIFASRTTDIWKETDKNRDNINSCFNFR